MDKTIQGNKLIAAFMSIDVRDFKWKDLHRLAICDNDGEVSFKYCEFYHPESDWNDLMPVVEKIEGLGVKVTIRNNFISLQGWVANNSNTTTIYEWDGGSTNDSKILSTWYGIVEFITWFNNQEKQ